MASRRFSTAGQIDSHLARCRWALTRGRVSRRVLDSIDQPTFGRCLGLSDELFAMGSKKGRRRKGRVILAQFCTSSHYPGLYRYERADGIHGEEREWTSGSPKKRARAPASGIDGASDRQRFVSLSIVFEIAPSGMTRRRRSRTIRRLGRAVTTAGSPGQSRRLGR